MPTYAKLTENVEILTWTTIQHKLIGGGQFGNTKPLDDIGGGGAGPHLVFENGVWVYPQQASVGLVDFEDLKKLSRPVRLMLFMADFGASADWTLTVASPTNTSDTPYPSANEPLYNMGSIQVAGGTGRYVSASLNVGNVDNGTLIHPKQKLYLTTTGAVTNAVVRFTFSRAFDAIV